MSEEILKEWPHCGVCGLVVRPDAVCPHHPKDQLMVLVPTACGHRSKAVPYVAAVSVGGGGEEK